MLYGKPKKKSKKEINAKRRAKNKKKLEDARKEQEKLADRNRHLF